MTTEETATPDQPEIERVMGIVYLGMNAETIASLPDPYGTAPELAAVDDCMFQGKPYVTLRTFGHYGAIVHRWNPNTAIEVGTNLRERGKAIRALGLWTPGTNGKKPT